MPPAIAFVFDGECLGQEQKNDYRRMDPGHVHFLPRRMYENYLLDPSAIAAVTNTIENFCEPPVNEDAVRRLFEQKREERVGGRQLRYFCDGIFDVPADWERTINGARLLADAFEELSETPSRLRKADPLGCDYEMVDRA